MLRKLTSESAAVNFVVPSSMFLSMSKNVRQKTFQTN